VPVTLWHALAAASDRGERVALCTVVGVDGSAPRASGARMIVHADGSITGTVGGGALEHRVRAEADRVLADGAPRRVAVHLVRDLGMCCGGAMEVYVEPVDPPERLVLFGAGHIAGALAPQAVALGFAVTVVDERDEWNTAARFPGCARVDRDARGYASAMDVAGRTFALVTTHDHALDQDLVERLLPRGLAWVGLVGSRPKAARFFLRFKAAGMDEALFAQLRVPVGLDLGAETPEEIALSIAAELVAVRRGRRGAVLPLSEIPLPARGGDGVSRVGGR
jgi:xanthine dehydrogenase accessory factor